MCKIQIEIQNLHGDSEKEFKMEKVKDQAKKISLDRYIMRIPYLFITLLFLLLVFIPAASALFFEKPAVNHTAHFLDSFLRTNREVFIEGDYNLLEQKIDRLLEHPSISEIKIFNANGVLILDRTNKLNSQSSGLLKLAPITIKRSIEPKKSANSARIPILWGTIQLTMSMAEESRMLQTLFLVLLGIFTLSAVIMFLFTRKFNRSMNKELLLLKDFIEKRTEVDSLQTRMFKVQELALIQKKIKSDSKDLRSLKEELEKKENLALIGNFASSIVHDIRNPLIVINGYVDMLKSKLPNTEQKYTEKIIDSTLMIERLLEDILKFVREQKLELKLAKHPAENVVQAAITYLEPVISSRSIHIAMEMERGLTVQCDIDRLSRAIMNLVKNSIEISRPGDTITLRTFKEKDAVVFSVRDKGPGIPASIRATIFEPFTTADKRKGTGLGLFISRSIAEAHNGVISFETGPSGAEFFIRIPA